MNTRSSTIVLILAVFFAVSGISYGCYDPPPYVFITCPEDGAPFVEGNDITIDANASDTSPGYITKVEFYKGATLLGEDTNTPYSFVWHDANYAPDGNLTLTARAYDNSGQSADSPPTHLSSTPTIWYVDDDAEPGGDGRDWTTAFKYLQDAIDAAQSDDQIWVAEGTYYPTVMVGGSGERYKTFQLEDGVSIYGGFVGGELSLAQRNWTANSAILSGDIGNPGDDSDNCYHVVTGVTGAVLDGFTITGGNSSGYGGGIYCYGASASPSISNCIIRNNKANTYGAGMFNSNSNPTLTNCTFSENSAYGNPSAGGGMYNGASSPTLTNCAFIKNSANAGGGIYNSSSSMKLTNCVFSGNSAKNAGGGIYGGGPVLINCTFNGNIANIGGGGISGGNPTITNCIFWDDTPNEISGSTPTVSYSDIQGGWTGEGNIDQDPCFVNTANPEGPDGVFGTSDDGLRIMAYSKCVDRADGNPPALPTDITGRARVDVPYVENHGIGIPDYIDIGAYESLTVWFANDDATGANNGASWEDAFKYLQNALAVAEDGDEIWVAEGTYRPDQNSVCPGGSNLREETFQLKAGVGLYGGFAGQMTGPQTRDWTSFNNTILSGDIGVTDNNSDNSYHVVTGADNAVLDGFTIKYGNAYGDYPDGYGGGIDCFGASPAISNCTFSGNSAGSGGGLYCGWHGSPKITNCTFSDNSAGGGGGLSIAVYSCPVITNCIFKNNYASSEGGGAYSHSADIGVSFTNCVFSENIAGYGGGGMHLSFTAAVTNNCVFNRNEAPHGSGVRLMESDLHATNCTFFDNAGGAICNTWGWPIMTNCILWGAPHEIYTWGGGSQGDVTYCDLADEIYSGEGNIHTDPCFANAADPEGPDGVFGTWDDGLRIMAYSPCVDSADGDKAPSKDITGKARVDVPYVENHGTGVHNYVDIGAYESPTVWFVDDDASDASGRDGSSWASDKAFKYLRDALDSTVNTYLTAGDEIWVAVGTYKPDEGVNQTPDSRTETFNLIKDVDVYGGFTGEVGIRDWRNNETILSGDIDGDGTHANNSYRVVTGANGAILDGFTITGGNADDYSYKTGGGIYCYHTSPSISNCVIRDNKTNYDYSDGAGMYNYDSSPTVTGCTFSGNSASGNPGYGGGMCNAYSSSPTLTNCVFSGNSAYNGGGIYNSSDSEPELINCTFTGNTATTGGGISGGNPTITNCIFWGDVPDEISGGTPIVTYSDIKLASGVWAGTGNINSDPCFVDPNLDNAAGPDGVFGTSDDGLRILGVFSQCTDRADGDKAPSRDITGRGRIDVPYVENHGTGVPDYVDIGAYESPTVWLVNDDATGANNSASWEDAFKYLQDALAVAEDGDLIWVAEGTYKPDQNSVYPDGSGLQKETFQLKSGVGLYGGFAGVDSIRDIVAYETILSGDLAGDDSPNFTNYEENSYHVVTGADNAILDGFTITGGNANGSDSPYHVGGGIYCGDGASPTIKNCVISKNNSTWFGGGLYVSAGGNPTITDCIFKNNRADESGGGAHVCDTSAQFTNCVFSENTIVYPSDIIDGGGGISIWLSSLPVIIENCVFSRNQGLHGSAIQSMQNSSSNLEITNCTFSNNYDLGYGTIYNYNSNPIITNCILWDTAQEIYNSGSTPVVTYCDIKGGYPGVGNIDSDPIFFNPDIPEGQDGLFRTDDDGLRLKADSDGPCIDSANGDVAPSTDILGHPRVDFSNVDNNGSGVPDYADIGAYELYSPLHLVHFSGLSISDHASPYNFSMAFVDDAFSDIIEHGYYDNALEAIPKSGPAPSSLDAIAIRAGTKVTFYSERELEGNVLLEKSGPRIIINRRLDWEPFPSDKNRTWSEPLQSEFPQEVREWSETDMTDWINGSFKIELVIVPEP